MVILEHLVQVCYNYEECDNILVYSDFNGRIGLKQDFIVDIDDVVKWSGFDTVHNKQGDALISFLLEVKFASINGKITTGIDNYTSISSKGATVID